MSPRPLLVHAEIYAGIHERGEENFVQFTLGDGCFYFHRQDGVRVNMCPRFKEDVMRGRTMWWLHDAEGV